MVLAEVERSGCDEGSVGMKWRARGLLFENCSCQLVCPGHVHFDQLCTHTRCKGYWAIRIDEGMFDSVSLECLKAVVVYDAPQHMIEGDWTERIIIDDRASTAQRDAIEIILSGRAGGPWALLSKFVGRWLDTQYLPIDFIEDNRNKRVRIKGILDSSITDIRGRDRTQPVTFENIFNQIHSSSQVLARGSTHYTDDVVVISNDNTHGLFSSFEWVV